jgi:pimeloyl-ACP methyl ester carboxylesterase
LTQHLYIFSGLGADERVFKNLHFEEFSTTFIRWIAPHNNESIEDYATRLLKQIDKPKPILIGLSFGGMMAVEVAKQIDVEKVILIASAKNRQEIPFYYRLAGWLGIHKLLPISLMKRSNVFTNYFFGVKLTSDKQLLKQILIDTDPDFLKWAIDKIINWKNQTYPRELIHIHGTSDRILPYCLVSADIKIKSGGHLMTLNKALELNNVLEKVLVIVG